MIKFDKDLLVDKKLGFRRLHIQKRLLAGKFTPGLFLITNPTNQDNVYDIIESIVLGFEFYKQREVIVYGMALSEEVAKELLLKLVENREW